MALYQPIPTSYNQIIEHTIEQALALSVNAKNEKAIAEQIGRSGGVGYCLRELRKLNSFYSHI